MKDATCPRVRGASGQNSGGAALQPEVMPAAASASMTWKNGWVAGTSSNRGPPGAGLS